MEKIKAAAVLCCVLLLTACGDHNISVTESVSSAVSTPFEESARYSEDCSDASETSVPDESPSSSSVQTTFSEPAETSEPPETSETVETSEPSASEPSSDPEGTPLCRAFALYCVDDNKLLSSENADAAVSPASLTKLLTASVALRYAGADEVFTVGTEQELVKPGSSICFIAPGHKLKLYDLITGMLLPSGNDAAYAVAVSTARMVSGDHDMTDTQALERFSGLMNELAGELGMSKSRFANPDGWDDDAHYTTVSDLVKLAGYALSVPEIREIVSVPKKDVVFETGEIATWFNSNKLLHHESGFYCENAIGMKTGTTDNAGCCLIAAFVKGGKTYITVVVGCENDSDRYELTLELFDAV